MVEDLLKAMIENNPNYYDLGRVVHEVYNQLSSREKTPHPEFDRIDERIMVTDITHDLRTKNL